MKFNQTLVAGALGLLAVSGCADQEQPSFEEQAMEEFCTPEGIDGCSEPELYGITNGSRVRIGGVGTVTGVDCDENGGGTMIMEERDSFNGDVINEFITTPGACFELRNGVTVAVIDCMGAQMTVALCEPNSLVTTP